MTVKTRQETQNVALYRTTKERLDVVCAERERVKGKKQTYDDVVAYLLDLWEREAKQTK